MLSGCFIFTRVGNEELIYFDSCVNAALHMINTFKLLYGVHIEKIIDYDIELTNKEIHRLILSEPDIKCYVTEKAYCINYINKYAINKGTLICITKDLEKIIVDFKVFELDDKYLNMNLYDFIRNITEVI